MILLPTDMYEKLDKFAKELDMKKSAIVRKALKQYLEEAKK